MLRPGWTALKDPVFAFNLNWGYGYGNSLEGARHPEGPGNYQGGNRQN